MNYYVVYGMLLSLRIHCDVALAAEKKCRKLRSVPMTRISGTEISVPDSTRLVRYNT
jgi:hypothetical protein